MLLNLPLSLSLSLFLPLGVSLCLLACFYHLSHHLFLIPVEAEGVEVIIEGILFQRVRAIRLVPQVHPNTQKKEDGNVTGGKIEDEQALAVNRSRGAGYLDAISSGDRCRAWRGAVTACDTRKNMLESIYIYNTSIERWGWGRAPGRTQQSGDTLLSCRDRDKPSNPPLALLSLRSAFRLCGGEVTYAAHKGSKAIHIRSIYFCVLPYIILLYILYIYIYPWSVGGVVGRRCVCVPGPRQVGFVHCC